MSLSCFAGEEELCDLCGYPNLKEALKWYDHLLRRKAGEFFRQLNGPPPEDCPDTLKGCFAGSKPARRKAAPEKIQRAKEEMEREMAAARRNG